MALSPRTTIKGRGQSCLKSFISDGKKRKEKHMSISSSTRFVRMLQAIWGCFLSGLFW